MSTKASSARRAKHAADVADYVAHMCTELAVMAEAAQLDLLGYLLTLARAEAEEQARTAAFSAKIVPLKS